MSTLKETQFRKVQMEHFIILMLFGYQKSLKIK